jgi:putative NADH-flavin reductase
MKVAVLGASGGCGKELVAQALERGHQVTAVVRGSSTLNVPASVRVERGDFADVAFLSKALAGSDAVLSAVGIKLKSLAPWSKPEVPDFLTRSTPALVAAMKASGVKRIVAISAGGVGDSLAQVPGVFRLMIKTTALKLAYAELDVMERTLRASGLEVCICRPTGLTDGPRTGQVKVCTSFEGRATISRADVAAWMLDEVVKPAFAVVTPMISVTGVP